MNIQEDYVSFEVAKLLKAKGFNENTEHKIWYVIKQFSTGCHWNSCTYKVGDITREYNNDCCIPMPTLQMAMKWLRVKHRLHVLPEIIDVTELNPKYYCVIWDVVKHRSYVIDVFDSYEQACEEAIKHCLVN